MDNPIDQEVVLVQDLVELGVVSVAVDRLEVLLHEREQAGALNCDADVLEKRRSLLEKISQSLPVNSIAHENAENEFKDDDTEEEDEAAVYVKYDLVYTNPGDDTGAPSSDCDEDAAQSFANAVASNHFFNELFPTEEVTKQRNLIGSFPDIKDFEGDIEFVGKGFSGFVFKATLDGVPVVLKVSKKRNANANRSDYKEWSVSDRLKAHPNVLQVFGLCPSFEKRFFKGVGTTAIISPWQENGALRAFYDSETRTHKEDDLENVALGMIRGIRSLHEQGVVHRDIAVRNFLVDIDGRVMLCDFGLTRFIPDGEDHIDNRKMPGDVLLPWQYLAPESFGHIFSTKSDMWMYGIALFELVTKRTPWPTFKPEDFRKAMEARELEVPAMEDFPPIIAGIVRDCLQFDPAARPTANDVAERLVRWQFRDMDLDRDEHGNTRLHQLVASGDREGVRHLLFHSQKPVMVNAVNHMGETPLMLARFSRIVDMLLGYQKVPFSNEEPSRVADCFHNTDVFGALLKFAETQDVSRILCIGDSEEFDHLIRTSTLDKRRGPNGETPLHTASRLGNNHLLGALLRLKAFKIWRTDDDGRNALHVASLHGHADIVMRFSRDYSDDKLHGINTQDKEGKAALHLAAVSGSVTAVEVLLNRSATNINIRDFKERPPMFDITLADNIDAPTRAELLRAFVHHPDIDMQAKDSTGETMLHKVARYDFAESAEILLQIPSTDIFAREREHNHAPIQLSIREKSFSVATILLSKWDANVNERDKYGNTLLHILAAASLSPKDAPENLSMMNLSFAKTLVSRDDVDLNLLNSRGDTPLHIAIEQNNLTVVEAMISAPGEKLCINQRDKKSRTPLLLAVESGKTNIVKLILSRSDVHVNAADKYQRSQTPLHLASWKNAVEVVAMLLSRDDINASARDERQQTPLHLASLNNAAEVAKMLLSRDDVDASARDERQETPLHCASQKNAAEVAKMLLSRDDVDVNARDERHRTPLHLASNGSVVEVAKMLLSRDDVDVNARDKDQRTPLHLASDNDAHGKAKMLVSRDDVDVNARDKDQQTPLHCASMMHAADTIKVLLSRDDVDVNACDSDGTTPLELAIEGEFFQEDDVDEDHAMTQDEFDEIRSECIALLRGVNAYADVHFIRAVNSMRNLH